jgi:hypothetical protein
MAVTIQGSGQIITQVIQATKSDRFSTTSTSYVAITGLSASITPKNANNKILVLIDLKGGANNSSGGGVQLLRNGTAIYIPSAQGSRRLTSVGSGYGVNQAAMQQMSANFMDSPSTTSAVTYSLQCVTNGATFGVNSSFGYTDSTDNVTSISSITLMEVAFS